MIAWWWFLIAVFIGATIGLCMCALFRDPAIQSRDCEIAEWERRCAALNSMLVQVEDNLAKTEAQLEGARRNEKAYQRLMEEHNEKAVKTLKGFGVPDTTQRETGHVEERNARFRAC